MKRTDLSALSILAAVASHRSFRGAAGALGLSVSAVSHAVSGLEKSLGFRLLSRTTRSVAPTAAGQRLLATVEPALSAIAGAIESASAEAQQLNGMIALTVPRTAVELVMMPIVAAFLKANPGVTVEVIVEDGFTDIVASRFDAGVRFGESLEQDMIAVPIGPKLRAAVVATPAYFTRRPIPKTPHDLVDHVCIRRRFGGGSLYRWEFEKEGQALDVAVQGALVLNDDRLIVEASLADMGLAWVFEAQVAREIATGHLIRVLESWCPPDARFFLYFPDRRLMRPVLRAFVDLAKRYHDPNFESLGIAAADSPHIAPNASDAP